MEEKRIFRPALRQLKVRDHAIAKRIIMDKCVWQAQSFGLKADGERSLTDRNKHKVNEFEVVESTLRGFGINAWTGETI